jgi:hypothetical protein
VVSHCAVHAIDPGRESQELGVGVIIWILRRNVALHIEGSLLMLMHIIRASRNFFMKLNMLRDIGLAKRVELLIDLMRRRVRKSAQNFSQAGDPWPPKLSLVATNSSSSLAVYCIELPASRDSKRNGVIGLCICARFSHWTRVRQSLCGNPKWVIIRLV